MILFYQDSELQGLNRVVPSKRGIGYVQYISIWLHDSIVVFTSNRYVSGVNMKITIVFHDKRPFINARIFKDFEYNGNRIDLVFNGFRDAGMDIYIYPYGTTEDNYKQRDPIASQIRRRQGYLVTNTLEWRRYHESHSQD